MAVSTVATPEFVQSAALVAVGSIAATVVTDLLRSNVVDLSLTGADALYAMVGAIVTMAAAGSLGMRNIGRPLALGMVASGVQTLLREVGVV